MTRRLMPESREFYEAHLICPPIPIELAYLHRVYMRLRRRKAGNGFGISPIEWPDIDAFNRNSNFNLTSWEVEVIENLDDLYLQAFATKDESLEDKSDE